MCPRRRRIAGCHAGGARERKQSNHTRRARYARTHIFVYAYVYYSECVCVCVSLRYFDMTQKRGGALILHTRLPGGVGKSRRTYMLYMALRVDNYDDRAKGFASALEMLAQ